MNTTENLVDKIINELEKRQEEVTILIERCRNIQLPEYMHLNDACMDLRAAEDVLIYPGETKAVFLGLKAVIPVGYELRFLPRSGLSLNTPLRIPNSPGIIDSGYRDEMAVIITNTSTTGKNTYQLNEKGNKQGIYEIKKGDRIAQMSVGKVIQVKLKTIEDVTKVGETRGGGMGHSGVK